MAKINVNLDSLRPTKEIKRHKVKEGTSVFRILPPHGENSNGYPYRKWAISWLQDPTSGNRRPYVSTLSTEGRCPLVEYTKNLQTKADKMKSEGASKEELRKIQELISIFRPKNSFLYNASDKDGNVGILELKATAHDQLKKHMGDYIKDYNQDPTSLNSDAEDSGVWFKFTRTGQKFDTKYAVEKEQMKLKENGRIVFADDRSALPEHVVQNYESLAYDIHSIYKVLTYDQVKEVMLANLRILESGGQVNNFGGNSEEQEAEEAPVVKAAKPKVNLRLEDESTDTTTSSGDSEDLFAMADSIFNS